MGSKQVPKKTDNIGKLLVFRGYHPCLAEHRSSITVSKRSVLLRFIRAGYGWYWATNAISMIRFPVLFLIRLLQKLPSLGIPDPWKNVFLFRNGPRCLRSSSRQQYLGIKHFNMISRSFEVMTFILIRGNSSRFITSSSILIVCK